MAEYILCGSDTGVIMFDLGAQPLPRHQPLPADLLPDPTHPLAPRLCPDYGLVQLDTDDTIGSEVPVPKPQAAIDQVRRAVTGLGRLGHLDSRTSIVEPGSPHGGSQLPLFGLTPTGGPADLMVDNFGLIRERDPPATLTRCAKALANDGLTVFFIRPLGDVVVQSVWTILCHSRHDHFILMSLRAMLGTVGIIPTSVLRYNSYGGATAVLTSRGGQPDANLLAAYGDESRRGLVIPEELVCLAEAVSAPTGRLRNYLGGHRVVGTRLFAYDAISKAVTELVMIGDAVGATLATGDTSLAKQGHRMLANHIPVISPAELIVANPTGVPLLLSDLHDEPPATHPSLVGRVAVPGANPTGTSRPIPPGGAVTCPGTPRRNVRGR